VPEQRRVVSIELSREQVDRVLRDASGAGSMSLLLVGAMDVRDVFAAVSQRAENRYLSRSLLWGLMLLAAFPADGSYVRNADIARSLDMPLSTAHRYLSTLVAAGLVERDPSTRQYRLPNVG
jgi:Fic family protein